MSEFKTLSEIKEETTGCLYYGALDYARVVAFTDFLYELEDEYKSSFRLVKANPKLFYNASIEVTAEMDRSCIFGVGLWANWAIDDIYYRLEMDNNPFFNAYLVKFWRSSDNKTFHRMRGGNMNDVLYADVDLTEPLGSIEQLKKNFRAVFNDVKENKKLVYISEIPAYDKEDVQTIYKF
jgi:hypothetical protein